MRGDQIHADVMLMLPSYAEREEAAWESALRWLLGSCLGQAWFFADGTHFAVDKL